MKNDQYLHILRNSKISKYSRHISARNFIGTKQISQKSRENIHYTFAGDEIVTLFWKLF